MRLGRTMLARVAVVALLAGSLVALSPGPAHAGVLTPRLCTQILSGDRVRRLDVCARGWVDDGRTVTRGVVEMHTYKLLGGINDWVDSTSQSITLERATVHRCIQNGQCYGGNHDWWQDWGQSPPTPGGCRVNGPGGSVGCSVPNTIRVAFYGPQIAAPGWREWWTEAMTVSWRDDRGVAHPQHLIDIDPDIEGGQSLVSYVWGA